MSRLFDRIRATGMAGPDVGAMLDRATVVVGDNVSDYYFMGTDQEEWDVMVDFPVVTPPLDYLFVECAAPQRVVSRVTGTYAWPGVNPRAWGVLMVTRDIVDAITGDDHLGREKELARRFEMYKPAIERAQALGGGDVWAGLDLLPEAERLTLKHYIIEVQSARAAQVPERQRALIAAIERNEAARWAVDAFLWCEWDKGRPRPVWHWDYGILGSGAITRLDAEAWCRQGPFPGARDGRGVTYEVAGKMADELASCLHTALLTVSFMHCKNVTRRIVEPPDKIVKRAVKEKGYVPARYYVLDIDPMKQVLRREGQIEQTGLKRALHICRGHFATYSPDHPLFGKYAGTFWRPMHVRGKPESGAVVKDYRVLSPAKGGKRA